MDDNSLERRTVWIFNGEQSGFPSAVFDKREDAEFWIRENQLTGVLTEYPMNIPFYDWAIDRGFFKPSKPSQFEPFFIGRFTSASMTHYHYENGTEGSD